MATTKIITEVTDLNDASSTNGLKMPTGTAYSGTPTDGMVRNDTTGSSQGSASTMQHFNGTEWKNYENLANTFTTDFLVVAGGGSGGGGYSGTAGGGGGAGGLRTTTTYSGSETPLATSLGTPYNVTVGTGGLRTTGNGQSGNPGNNSEFNGIISTGGGYGGTVNLYTCVAHGGPGGSGGGGGRGNGGTATPAGQGNAGGIGQCSTAAGAGGGGAGAIGANGVASGNGIGGDGGAGLEVNIIGGTGNYYAGGGGGCGTQNNYTGPAGAGGIGGGGFGTWTDPAGNGEINTGGGGGGMAGGFSGSGGSGTVILRYPTADVSSYAVTGTLDTVADTAYPIANTAYYKLEGGSGTTVTDSSGNGYNGTATSVTYAAGRFGNAAVFNGSSSYVTYNSFLSNTSNNSDASFSLWVNFNSFNSGLNAISAFPSGVYAPFHLYVFYNSGTGAFAFERGYNGTVYYAGSYASTLTKSINTNQWYHIVYNYTASNKQVEIFVDGISLGTDILDSTNTSQSIGNSLLLGGFNSSGNFDGKIDQFRIFNSAISAANVTSLYNEGTVVESTDGTDSILQFIGGTGTVTFS